MLRTHVPSYFKSRRQRLMGANPGAAFVFPGGAELLRNPDVTFPFRQENNFYYLTGFEDPDSFLVLTPSSTSSKDYKMVLFVRPRDPTKEMWTGERYGTEAAVRVFGADESYTIDQLEKVLPELLRGAESVFYRLGLNESADRIVLNSLDTYRCSLGRSGKGILPIHDPVEAIADMRLFKTTEEIEILRRAAEGTAAAHKKIMQDVRPGMNEADVAALIEFEFRHHGCERVAFGTIVAGGKNAACLHYVSNNEPLQDGQLLLVDAGGERDYYAADITRTFPIGRAFSDVQAKLYDLVLKAELAGIDMVKPGVTLFGIHQTVCRILVEGMLSLGLLKGKRDELAASGEIKRFYPHSTSHWIGMDVHDVGFYTKDGEPRTLEPGMYFSVEPGFYIQPGDKNLPSGYGPIGIRIEDDVLVTADGHEVPTQGVPKARSEIEALRRF